MRNQYIVPTVLEKSPRHGIFAYDIYSRLLEDRIIFIGGPINDAVANTVIAQMLYLENKDSKKDIKLYINSPGGVVTAGLAIYDTIRYLSCQVQTICIGMAASMAAVILSSGTKGKRFALPNAEVMLHQVMGGVEGQAIEIKITAEHIMKMRQKLNKILAANTGKSLKQIEADTDREFYLSAEEARKYGLIDKIISKRK